MKKEAMTQANSKYKYVFVCGLHRSGTSVLGRNIARLQDATGFQNTGTLMDEGQHLQDVYPPAAEYGGVGRFGFDPRAHLTERSDLLTPKNITKLRASWHAHWDSSKTICVEKTPGNLLMTRFLQAAFPNCYFVVIRRHPVPVSMASQKWKVNVTSLDNLFEHWLRCHEIFEKDRKYLKHIYDLRYEDYIENPNKCHEEIAAFIGTRIPEPPKEDEFRIVVQWPNPTELRVPEGTMEDISRVHNQRYLDRWRNLLTNSFFKSYYCYIAKKYESRFARYNYSLTEGLGVDEVTFDGGRQISSAIGTLCCRGADACAFCQRFGIRSKHYIKQQIKSALPAFVLARVRQVRQKAALSMRSTNVVSS